MDMSNYIFGIIFPEPLDIPNRISDWFKTSYLLYYTGPAFGLCFREQKIQFGYVTEEETRERWRNMAADRKKRYMDLRTSIKRYRMEKLLDARMWKK